MDEYSWEFRLVCYFYVCNIGHDCMRFCYHNLIRASPQLMGSECCRRYCWLGCPELAVNCIFVHRTPKTNVDARGDGWHAEYECVKSQAIIVQLFSHGIQRWRLPPRTLLGTKWPVNVVCKDGYWYIHSCSKGGSCWKCIQFCALLNWVVFHNAQNCTTGLWFMSRNCCCCVKTQCALLSSLFPIKGW